MRIQSRDIQATCIPSRFPFFGNPVPRFLPSDPNPAEEGKRRQKRSSHTRPPFSSLGVFFRVFFSFFFRIKIDDRSPESGISPRGEFFSPFTAILIEKRVGLVSENFNRGWINENEESFFFFFFRWGKGDKSWLRIDKAHSVRGKTAADNNAITNDN